jgi:ABC-type transport system substrate-binding protein
MQAIGADEAKIGIHMKLKVVDIGSLVRSFYNGPVAKRDTMYLEQLGCYSGPDPGQTANEYLSYGSFAGSYPWNYLDFVDPTIEKLTAEGEESSNRAQRLAIYTKLVKLVNLELPMIPMTTQWSYGAISNKFSFSSYGGGYGWYGSIYWPFALAISKT